MNGEVITGGVIVAIFSGMLAYLLGTKDKATIQDLEEHKKDPNPHVACPVHTTEIIHIKTSLSNIEGKVDKIIEKIV